MLRRFYDLPVYDINFGARSTDGHYYNKRTEMWFKLRDWIKQGGILPDDPVLLEELATPTYDVNENNLKILESKQKIKDRTGKSPDKGDSVALTFAVEITPDTYVDPVDPYAPAPLPRVIETSSPLERFERECTRRYNQRYYNRRWDFAHGRFR